MPRISKPDTRTGDDGTTSTIQGKRVYKDAPLITAFGTLDELNSAIGLVLTSKGLPDYLKTSLHSIQNTLFHLGSDLDLKDQINGMIYALILEKKKIDHLSVICEKLETRRIE